jgi:hypothetical protein
LGIPFKNIIVNSQTLNNLYFFIRQAVEVVDKLVDLAVGGVDLALQGGLYN